MNPQVLTVLVNTTVRLISINWRQTCGFTIYAKQRRKPVEAANSEPYRLLMNAKQCAINLQADEKSHYCLICSSFTLINQNIAMAHILFTHTALLIQLSLPLPICLVRVRLALKAPGKRIQERRFF